MQFWINSPYRHYYLCILYLNIIDVQTVATPCRVRDYAKLRHLLCNCNFAQVAVASLIKKESRSSVGLLPY